MIPLNYKKARVNELLKVNRNKGYVVDHEEVLGTWLLQDWLTMHAELTRLNKAIEGAMREIETSMKNNPKEDDVSNGICEGYKIAIDILRKHIGKE